MEKEYLLGLMVGNMRVITIWIKNKGWEAFHGQMAGNTMVNGRMENNKVRVSIEIKTVSLSQEYGNKAKK